MNLELAKFVILLLPSYVCLTHCCCLVSGRPSAYYACMLARGESTLIICLAFSRTRFVSSKGGPTRQKSVVTSDTWNFSRKFRPIITTLIMLLDMDSAIDKLSNP